MFQVLSFRGQSRPKCKSSACRILIKSSLRILWFIRIIIFLISEHSDKLSEGRINPACGGWNTKSKEPMQNMFNSLSEKTGNLASTVWQNGTAKAALGTAAGTAGAVASGVGSTIYKQAGTVGAVAGGIGSTIFNQAAKMMDRNQKLKENFACYYLKDMGEAYVGTIHFTRKELIFCSEALLPQHIKSTKRDLPLLPIGEKSWKDCYERRGFVLDRQITLAWGDIKEINIGGDPENPFVRHIEIITHQKYYYLFMGFLNHQKAFAHLYSLLESSSWS